MKFISSAQLIKNLDKSDFVIIDIRESYERDICKIKSIHIPMAEILKRVDEIPRDKSVVIYCKSGNRAQVLVNFLEKENNFSNLFVLEGGIMAWIDNIDKTLEKY